MGLYYPRMGRRDRQLKTWHLLLIILALGTLLVGMAVVFPNYNYHGVASTPEEAELVWESTKGIHTSDLEVSWKGPNDKDLY